MIPGIVSFCCQCIPVDLQSSPVCRDSLGGNCKTFMIATVNPSEQHIEESFFTCRYSQARLLLPPTALTNCPVTCLWIRFAHRLCQLTNSVSANRTQDPSLTVQQLQDEVSVLRSQLSRLKVGDRDTAPRYLAVLTRDSAA